MPSGAGRSSNQFIGVFSTVRGCSDSSLVDHELAAVISAFAAYGVVYVPCAAVGAYCDRRDKCFVVGAAFRGAGVRLSAFRMCHCSIVLIVSVL